LKVILRTKMISIKSIFFLAILLLVLSCPKLFANESENKNFAIDPNVTIKDNQALLRCNDENVLPKIVDYCFSEMSCLETAELGSNASNAKNRRFSQMLCSDIARRPLLV